MNEPEPKHVSKALIPSGWRFLRGEAVGPVLGVIAVVLTVLLSRTTCRSYLWMAIGPLVGAGVGATIGSRRGGLVEIVAGGLGGACGGWVGSYLTGGDRGGDPRLGGGLGPAGWPLRVDDRGVDRSDHRAGCPCAGPLDRGNSAGVGHGDTTQRWTGWSRRAAGRPPGRMTAFRPRYWAWTPVRSMAAGTESRPRTSWPLSAQVEDVLTRSASECGTDR
jgi:hypothetical protein